MTPCFSFHLADWGARIATGYNPDYWSGCEPAQWQDHVTEIDAPLAQLPMMTARRLSQGDRLAVDCALGQMRRHPIDALVFSSRHGELENNRRILHALATSQPVSPTDFAMSVHNAAAGTCTIVSKQPVVTSSISAGVDTFQQALWEAHGFLQSGHARVLLLDFDGPIPDFYRDRVGVSAPLGPFAVGLLLETGRDLQCTATLNTARQDISQIPQSLQFIRGWLGNADPFTVQGERFHWHWKRSAP